MMTVGPKDIEVMSLYDWASVTQFMSRRTDMPQGALHALVLDPSNVKPQDATDELEDLHDLLMNAGPDYDNVRDHLLGITEAALARLKKAGFTPKG